MNKISRNKRTMIISTSLASEKDYLCNHQNDLTFRLLDMKYKCSFANIDPSWYVKTAGWGKRYVDDIESEIGIVDFVLIAQREEVFRELRQRNIPFVVIVPWTSENSNKWDLLEKWQCFKNLLARKREREEPMSADQLRKYNPSFMLQLWRKDHLKDRIPELYAKKERDNGRYSLPKKQVEKPEKRQDQEQEDGSSKMVKTNMGSMPLEDYLEIIADIV